MTQKAVALTPELHACVNQFLAQANAMHAAARASQPEGREWAGPATSVTGAGKDASGG